MLKVSDYRTFLSVFALLLLLGAAAPAWAQAPVSGRNAEASGKPADDPGKLPQIQFATMEHDFGQAPSGEELKTSFTFKNVGEGVLVIEKVKGG